MCKSAMSRWKLAKMLKYAVSYDSQKDVTYCWSWSSLSPSEGRFLMRHDMCIMTMTVDLV